MRNIRKKEQEELLKETEKDFLVFQTGFVIELGRGEYFRCIRNGSISCGTLPYVRRFQSQGEAERYVFLKLHYYGLEAHICRTAWYLGSWDEAGKGWDGSRFTDEIEKAVLFESIREAEKYQKSRHLEMESYIEGTAVRMQCVAVRTA